MTARAREPIELIPPVRQRLWGWPAVANFALGGLGAGLYLAAVLAARFESSPAVVVASWVGPLLVLAGFAAVATEAGRPWRGARVMARVRSSWMSRELVLGGAFAVLAAAELVAPRPWLRVAAGVAAAGLALAQGFIVRRARAVVAWDVGVMPPAFLLSALVSGAGLLLVIETGRGLLAGAGRSGGAEHLGGDILGGVLVTMVAGALVWLAYLTWSTDATFLAATAPLREGPAAIAILGGGYVVPFVLVAVVLALGEALAPAAMLAGALMIAAQVHAKTVLILEAAMLRPVSLSLPATGRERIEERPGVPGARRARGGFGGPVEAPHAQRRSS